MRQVKSTATSKQKLLRQEKVMANKTNENKEYQPPIKLGGLNITVFLMAVAVVFGLLYLCDQAWLGTACVVLMFQGVRILHPTGWTGYLREWYSQNVIGQMEIYYINSDIVLDWWYQRYKRAKKPMFGTPKVITFLLCFHRSGWASKITKMSIRDNDLRLVDGWKIIAVDYDPKVSWGDRNQGPPGTGIRVLLQHPDGSRLHFSIEGALQAMNTLTTYGETRGNVICMTGARPFQKIWEETQGTSAAA